MTIKELVATGPYPPPTAPPAARRPCPRWPVLNWRTFCSRTGDLVLSKPVLKMFKSAKKLFKAIDTDHSAAIDANELYEFMCATLNQAKDLDQAGVEDSAASAEMLSVTPETIATELVGRLATSELDGFLASGFDPTNILATCAAAANFHLHHKGHCCIF